MVTKDGSDIEDFLQEIDKYAQKLKDCEKCDAIEDTEESHLNETNSEIDNLDQEVEMIKEELEDERQKVKKLKDTIIKKNKSIESLQSKIRKKEADKKQTSKKSRYWNREFCKKEEKKMPILSPF